MSAGVSNSEGSELGQTSSTGKRQGTSQTQGSTTFDTTTKQSAQIPQWAKQGNRNLFQDRSRDEVMAHDFLTGLLSDPYDNTGDGKNRFGDSIQRLFDTQLARARTGGTQNMGAARQGFREAAALTGAQDAAIGQGAQAAGQILTGPGADSSLGLANMFAPKTNQTSGTSFTDNTTTSNELTSGRQKSQTNMEGSNSGYGITVCCFIFLEAYNGKLPWYVRRCRDQFAAGPRVTGYNRMAARLVPLMRKSKLVSSLVNWLMIKPMTQFGGWLYNEPKHELGFVWAPVTAFWFALWSKLGGEQDANS